MDKRLQAINTIEEVKRKKKDPEFARYIAKKYYPEYYDDIEELVFGGQKENTVEVGGRQYKISDTITPGEAMKLQEEEKTKEKMTKLEADTMKKRLEDIDTLLVDEKGLKKAVGTGVFGRGINLPANIYTDPDRSRFAGGAAQVVSVESLQALIDAKGQGATFGALSNEELKMLQQAATKLGQFAILDEDGKIVGFNASEEEVNKELQTLKEKTLAAYEKTQTGVSQEGVTTEAETTQAPTGSIDLTSPEQANEWLKQNPNHPQAQAVKARLQEVGFTETTQEKPAGDLETPTPMDQVATEKTMEAGTVKQPTTQEDAKAPLYQRIGEGLGSFFGGKQWGRAIGNVVGSKISELGDAGETFQNTLAQYEKMRQEGKITEEQYGKLVENTEQTMKDTFGYKGPGLKQLAGDTVFIATNFLPMAKAAAGATLGTKALVAGANVGKAALAGMASATAEDKDLGEIAKAGATSAATYGAVTAGAKALGGITKMFGGVAKRVGAAMSGLGDEVIDEIIENPKLAREGMNGGAVETIKKNAKETIGFLDQYIDETNSAYKTAMGSLSDVAVDNENVKGSLSTKIQKLLTSRGVAVTKEGLDFSKSRFIEPGDEKRISILWDEINKASDMSPQSLNVLRQRASELMKSQSDDNKIINAVITGAKNAIKEEIDGMGSEISSINTKYSDRIDFVNAMKRELGSLGSTKRVSRADLIDVEKRIGTLFTKNKDSARALFKEMGAGDVVARQAGSEVKRVNTGQSSRISDAVINMAKSIGLPRFVGELSAVYGDAKNIEKALKATVEKVVSGKDLSDIERRLLSKVIAVFQE